MFLENSRYAKVEQDETETREGRKVTALRLRRLPATTGEFLDVKDDERLDLLAHARYGDATRHWHVADANSALDARELTAQTGAVIQVPKS